MHVGNKLFPYPTINNEGERSCFKETTYTFNCNEDNDGQNYIFPIEKISTALSLIEDTENSSLSVHKGLRKSYIWSKKIKLAIYKLIVYVPKLISGNYRRKIAE